MTKKESKRQQEYIKVLEKIIEMQDNVIDLVYALGCDTDIIRLFEVANTAREGLDVELKEVLTK